MMAWFLAVLHPPHSDPFSQQSTHCSLTTARPPANPKSTGSRDGSPGHSDSRGI